MRACRYRDHHIPEHPWPVTRHQAHLAVSNVKGVGALCVGLKAMLGAPGTYPIQPTGDSRQLGRNVPSSHNFFDVRVGEGARVGGGIRVALHGIPVPEKIINTFDKYTYTVLFDSRPLNISLPHDYRSI